MDEARMMEVFMDIQRGLPRQGPGNDEATRRALGSCKDLPDRPEVLDIGCGPGKQSLVLAKELGAHVTAVDLHQEFLDQLTAESAEAGLGERISPMLADMTALNFEAARFDLIWAEGSAYIMGVAEALRAWKGLLKPGGRVALTELLWLTGDPPPEAAAFFGQEYPPMTDIAGNLTIFAEEGYGVIGHFTIPDMAWWDQYYTPLKAKLPGLRERYASDQDALDLIKMTETEIDMRERHGDSYGYEFFVAEEEA